jgi:hypothetical protein
MLSSVCFTVLIEADLPKRAGADYRETRFNIPVEMFLCTQGLDLKYPEFLNFLTVINLV